MTLSTNPIPGTRDFFPEEMSVRQQVFGALYRTVESFGYARYDGPMLEPFELYAAKSSEEIVASQTYRLKDRGERDLVVRPEMTPTVARMIAAKAGSLTLPARWYSHPNLWRYERKQRGRYREHWQVNVDLFGTESWEAEREVFEVLGEMMLALGAKPGDFAIRVSDRNVMHAAMTRWAGVPDDKVPAVYRVLDALDKVPESETAKSLGELGVDADKVLSLVAARNPDRLFEVTPKEVLEASNLYKLVNEEPDFGTRYSLKYDPTIIRGFDYYTSTVFELHDTDPANRRSIAGGGRYDNLVGLFGKARIPGIGFGMGDVTLLDFLETHGYAPAPRSAADVTVLTPQAENAAMRRRVHEVAARLRREGLRVAQPLEARKLGKLLERAAKEGVRAAVLVGEAEAARGAVMVRDLGRSEQHEVSDAELAGQLRALLATAPVAAQPHSSTDKKGEQP